MSDFKLKPWNRGITNEELLADLRRIAELIGRKTVRREEYPQYGRCHSTIFERRFGSWNKALIAAGLKVSSRHDITEEELYENMERVWVALGRQPKREELKNRFLSFPAVLTSTGSKAGVKRLRAL